MKFDLKNDKKLMLGFEGDVMDEFIIISILALSLSWIAIVAYFIYKDHGVVEFIDGEPYRKILSFTPQKSEEKLNLGERLRKRLRHE